MKHFFGFQVVIAASVAVLCSGAANASEFFPTFNQGSLQRSAALPALGAAWVLSPGESSWYGALDLTTEYFLDANASEELLADGESARFALSYRAALAEGWEWDVQVPILVLGGGFMDSIIQDWHGYFGLPNGGRELAPRNDYQFRYTRNGVTLLDVQDSGTYLGDVRVGLGWQWREATALRAQLKLPSGDGEQLGGGNTGLALWLDHAFDFSEASRWSAYASAGGSFISAPKILADMQNRTTLFGGAGLSYSLLDSLSVSAQLYAHTALYKDSALDSLSDPGLQFVLGGSWRVTPTTTLNLAFQEDPIITTSPDFSLHFGWSFE